MSEVACAEILFLTRTLTDPNFDLNLEFDDHVKIRNNNKVWEVALIRSRFEHVLALLVSLRSVREERIIRLIVSYLFQIIDCGYK